MAEGDGFDAVVTGGLEPVLSPRQADFIDAIIDLLRDAPGMGPHDMAGIYAVAGALGMEQFQRDLTGSFLIANAESSDKEPADGATE